MSEDMEELERWEPRLTCVDLEEGPATKATMEAMPSGEWVRFSDVEEREARLKAQVKEARKVAAKASAARIRADRNADARWRERIQGEINDRERRIGQALGADGDHSMAGRHQGVVRALRSLLDSGEESDCPDCAGEEIRGCSRCDGSGRATTPSPAFHREGREQFCPEKTQKNWTTDGRSAPVAVPDKVEVDAEDLELILTDTDIYYPGYAEDSDEPSGLPERGAAAEDRLRAALAAFRATEEGE